MVVLGIALFLLFIVLKILGMYSREGIWFSRVGWEEKRYIIVVVIVFRVLFYRGVIEVSYNGWFNKWFINFIFY